MLSFIAMKCYEYTKNETDSVVFKLGAGVKFESECQAESNCSKLYQKIKL